MGYHGDLYSMGVNSSLHKVVFSLKFVDIPANTPKSLICMCFAINRKPIKLHDSFETLFSDAQHASQNKW